MNVDPIINNPIRSIDGSVPTIKVTYLYLIVAGSVGIAAEQEFRDGTLVEESHDETLVLLVLEEVVVDGEAVGTRLKKMMSKSFQHVSYVSILGCLTGFARSPRMSCTLPDLDRYSPLILNGVRTRTECSINLSASLSSACVRRRKPNAVTIAAEK